MVDKTELLRMIMQNNPGQTSEYILKQFEQYVKGLSAIEACVDNPTIIETLDTNIPIDTLSKKTDKESITCGYTKRNLKVKPSDAILEDKIICCLCGEERKTITERHLSKHNGLTREGYLKLCGYAPDQPLMALSHLERMKNNVRKAQYARKNKKSDKKI